MPRAFDQQAKDRYVIAIGRGRRPATAAENLGFTWATVRKHLQSDPVFAQEVADASMRADELVEEAIFDQAVEGHFSAGKWWLENRQPQRWQDRSKQAVGSGGTVVNIGVITTDALREVLTDTDSRAEALAFLKDIPAIEATAAEAS